jgi:N-methylhydantoinase A
VTEIARQLELKRVVVPRLASVLSAWGMLTSDLRYEVGRTHIGDASRLDADALRALYADMEGEGRRRLAQAAFDGEVLVHRSAEMRYGEQIFEVGVDLDGVDWQARDLLAQLAAAFHRRHEELYTYALPDQEAVLVNARVAVIGRLPALPQEPRRGEGPPAPPCDRRRIWLGGWHEAPVFDIDALRPGQHMDGPALVESATTTALLRLGDRARLTEHGWLDISIAGAR